MFADRVPVVAAIRRAIHFATSGAKVDPAAIATVYGHRLAENVDVAVLLWEAVGECLPIVATRSAAINPQLSIGNEVLGVAFDRNDVNRFGFVRVYVNRKSEVAWKAVANFMPLISGVVASHDVPVLLHEKAIRV